MSKMSNKQRIKFILSIRLKGCLNFSQTMNIVPDFCHRLSIGPACDIVDGPRQI